MAQPKTSARSTKLPQPAGTVLEVTDLEQLRVISDPLRVRILHSLFGPPMTVKQVADQLELPATKLYYHVGELERIGLVKVVETRIKSGIIEKYYRTVADHLKVSRDLLKLTKESAAGSTYAELPASMLEATADDIRLAAVTGTFPPEDTSLKIMTVSHSTVKLKRAAAARFVAKINKLMTEIDAADDKAGEIEFGVTTAFFPMKRLDTQAETDHD